jgi:hypothetical protein
MGAGEAGGIGVLTGKRLIAQPSDFRFQVSGFKMFFLKHGT